MKAPLPGSEIVTREGKSASTIVVRAILLLGFALAVLTATVHAQNETKPEPTHKDVPYGLHERNVLDFWKSKSDGPTPFVVFNHGGGFAGGGKEELKSSTLQDLLDAGISVAAVNYRYYQQAGLPAALHDCRRALQFMRSKAAEWQLDKSRVAAAGGSAGAITSMYLACHDDMANPASGDPVERGSASPQSGMMDNAPQPFPEKVVGMYYMLWGGKGGIKAIPKEVNVIFLAFAQGDPPTLVGYGDEGEGGWAAAIEKARARGVRIMVSIGGSGGKANVGNRDAFVNGILAINEKAQIDGLDWDLEGPTMTKEDIVYICTTLKRKLGKNFAITMAPNGGNVGEYIDVAVALHQADALDMIGQQFYDAQVSVDAAEGRINQMISAGIPENKVAIGMMNGKGSNYWSVGTCVQNVTTLKRKHPNLRGGYLWESGRDGAAQWASQVGALLMR